MSRNNRIGLWWLPIAVVSVLLLAGIVALVVYTCLPPGRTEPTNPTNPTEPTGRASASDLVCRMYSRFSGQYVEDGSDEPVENVAAILVSNTSAEFLDLANFTYIIDGKTATFVASGLPPGGTAWLMESSRMTIGEDAVFTYVDCVCSFRVKYIDTTDKLSVYEDGHNLAVKNESGETLKDVYLYYKVYHSDGNFLGGITYRVGFGDLEPGATAESIAGHYAAENSRIVRISWEDG